MSTRPSTYTGEVSNVKSDDSVQGMMPTKSSALNRKSLQQPSFIGEEIANSTEQSPPSVAVPSLHFTSSEPIMGSQESPLVRARPRAKSVPTIIEQQVALFLRTISDDINNSYGNRSPNATHRNRRASYPGNIRLQETLSPLLRALPFGIRPPTNAQREGASGVQGGAAVMSQHSSSSMNSVPEEESGSGDEV